MAIDGWEREERVGPMELNPISTRTSRPRSFGGTDIEVLDSSQIADNEDSLEQDISWEMTRLSRHIRVKYNQKYDYRLNSKRRILPIGCTLGIVGGTPTD
jgi:hypothetical protein